MVRVRAFVPQGLSHVVACGLLWLGGAAGLSAATAPPPKDQLKNLSLEELGNVEVTTVSKVPETVWQTPAAVYVLTRDDIRRSGATTLPDLLRTVPGVEVAELQADQWAVGIRGFGSAFSKDVLLLIDGRSTYTPLFEGVYWDVQDVLLDDVERIEVIRGPGGTIWGANAVNGVINIVTRNARDTVGTLVTGESGYVDRFNGSVREGMGWGDRVACRLFAKGMVREDEQNAGNDAYDRWHLAHGGFRADWSPDKQDTFTVEGDAYTGASGQEISIGSYAPLQQLVIDDTFTISGGDVVVNWQHTYTGGSDLHAHAYFDHTNRQGTEFGETRDTVDFDFIDHVNMLLRQNLIWGGGIRFSPSSVIQTQPTVDFEPHGQTDYIYSTFLQDSFRLLPTNLTLTVGSKFEYNNYTGFEIQPSTRLLWNPVNHATLWAAVSRAVRTPGRLDRDLQLTDVYKTTPAVLVHIEGDPNFKSENLLGFEAGYRQLVTSKLYADVAAFENHYDKLESYGIQSYSAITTPTDAEVLNIPFANGIDGNTDGVEIAPDWKLAGWWELKGNFSHLRLDAHPRPGFDDTATAASYEGSSPHRMATLQSQVNLPHRAEFDFDYRFVSRLPAQLVESYQTMDAHTSWLLNKSLRFTVSGRNLLQPHHHEFAGDNDLPVGIRRSVYGGIAWIR
jgi:iron complex outermembrane receptor protein